MKLRTFITALLMLTLPLVSFSQDTPDEKNELPRLRVGTASIAVGAASGLSPSLKLQDFNELAPNSVLLQNDLNGFSNIDNYSSNSAVVLNAQVGIDFLDKGGASYNRGVQLHIGINYLGNMTEGESFSRTDRFRIDTLQSLQTGETTFIDSTYSQHYNMDYVHDQLQLDLSLIYRTQTKSLLSLYAGIGVSGGVSIVSRTDISYETRIEDNEFRQSEGNYAGSNVIVERFTNQSNFSVSGYIPIGVELRLGRERALWSQLKLFTEMRPGVSYFHIPDLNHSQTTPWYQQTIGIRYMVQQ